MTPVLFLDIDGVLNHGEAYERYGSGLIVAARSTEVLDPQCVRRLNRIVAESGCEVVVSSTWRLVHSLVRLELLLGTAGYEHHLLSTTPQLNRERGHEIQAWLKRHPGYGPIAILDDSADMPGVADRLVQTTFAGGGLRDEHVTACIAKLREAAE